MEIHFSSCRRLACNPSFARCAPHVPGRPLAQPFSVSNEAVQLPDYYPYDRFSLFAPLDRLAEIPTRCRARPLLRASCHVRLNVHNFSAAALRPGDMLFRSCCPTTASPEMRRQPKFRSEACAYKHNVTRLPCIRVVSRPLESRLVSLERYVRWPQFSSVCYPFCIQQSDQRVFTSHCGLGHLETDGIPRWPLACIGSVDCTLRPPLGTAPWRPQKNYFRAPGPPPRESTTATRSLLRRRL